MGTAALVTIVTPAHAGVQYNGPGLDPAFAGMTDND
jgi:hypothetical protein